MINGVASTPFSATTLPPIAELTGNEDKVIKVSRERYTTPREVVEEKINKWMGSEFHSQAAAVESSAVEQEDLQEEMRYQHAAASSPQEIRQTAPLAPRREEERREEPPARFERRRDDRRPNRGPKPQREQPKRSDNPVWETVNKLNDEKLMETAKRVVTEAAKPPQPPPPTPEPPKPLPQIEPLGSEEAPAPTQQGVLKPGDKIQF